MFVICFHSDSLRSTRCLKKSSKIMSTIDIVSRFERDCEANVSQFASKMKEDQCLSNISHVAGHCSNKTAYEQASRENLRLFKAAFAASMAQLDADTRTKDSNLNDQHNKVTLSKCAPRSHLNPTQPAQPQDVDCHLFTSSRTSNSPKGFQRCVRLPVVYLEL